MLSGAVRKMAEKEEEEEKSFCRLQPLISEEVGMRGHASLCPTKISNKAVSYHNWVLPQAHSHNIQGQRQRQR